MFISASAYLRYDGCPHNNDYRLIINNAWLFQMPLIIALFYITRRARTIIGVRGRRLIVRRQEVLTLCNTLQHGAAPFVPFSAFFSLAAVITYRAIIPDKY